MLSAHGAVSQTIQSNGKMSVGLIYLSWRVMMPMKDHFLFVPVQTLCFSWVKIPLIHVLFLVRLCFFFSPNCITGSKMGYKTPSFLTNRPAFLTETHCVCSSSHNCVGCISVLLHCLQPCLPATFFLAHFSGSVRNGVKPLVGLFVAMRHHRIPSEMSESNIKGVCSMSVNITQLH